jgi:hypothetical protein
MEEGTHLRCPEYKSTILKYDLHAAQYMLHKRKSCSPVYWSTFEQSEYLYLDPHQKCTFFTVRQKTLNTGFGPNRGRILIDFENAEKVPFNIISWLYRDEIRLFSYMKSHLFSVYSIQKGLSSEVSNLIKMK